MRPITFIDTMPDVEIDRYGVLIVASSNGIRSTYRMHDAMWREYIDREVARLAERDRQDREKVVPIKRRKRAAH